MFDTRDLANKEPKPVVSIWRYSCLWLSFVNKKVA